LNVTLPRIAITMGDPAGVGPELCLKLIEVSLVRDCCVPIIFGDVSVLSAVADRLSLSLPEIVNSVSSILAIDEPTIVDFELIKNVTPGVVNECTGRASYAYIEAGMTAALRNDVAALVTGPIHKEAFSLAGVFYPGHTEMLADKTGADRFCMMLTSKEITCSLVTAHVGLNEVAPLLSTQRILDAIELSNDAMRQIRGHDVRLTVCGLNPHAGECGLLGEHEEEQLIMPAIETARRKGISVSDPLSPDTAFLPSIRADTDCYICMYHDQGLIPLKALAFDTAVNVTLGLPIIRTSVDHGTALDIAWQGKAFVMSFVKAVQLATQLVQAGQ